MILWFISSVLISSILSILLYEWYVERNIKKYICPKCNLTIVLPKDEDHYVYHNCGKGQNLTRLYKE